MIRTDAIWLATEPLDMRAGSGTVLARVVKVFGAAQPHCAYLFANRRGNCMSAARHTRRMKAPPNLSQLTPDQLRHLAVTLMKTHRAYRWAYATTPYAGLKAVIYDFSEGRSGQHARDFLGERRGNLVCDDYSGYKQSVANGVTEIGCMAHTRRKFVDLHVAGKSRFAEQAIDLIGQLNQVEREVKTLTVEERQRLRDNRARPIARRCCTARRRRKP